MNHSVGSINVHTMWPVFGEISCLGNKYLLGKKTSWTIILAKKKNVFSISALILIVHPVSFTIPQSSIIITFSS